MLGSVAVLMAWTSTSTRGLPFRPINGNRTGLKSHPRSQQEQPGARLCPNRDALLARDDRRAVLTQRRHAEAEAARRRRAEEVERAAGRAADPSARARGAREGAAMTAEAWALAAEARARAEAECVRKLERAAETRLQRGLQPGGWRSQRRDPSETARRAELRRGWADEDASGARREGNDTERRLCERAEAAQGQAEDHACARRANAARLNARVGRAAEVRQAWVEVSEDGAGGGRSRGGRPAWARINERRHRQRMVEPRVDPAAYAAKSRAAQAHARAKRAVVHPTCWRWQKAELLDIQELRDRCAVKGLDTLGSKAELDARLYFASAPQA